MTITIQQAITAHQEGKLDEAKNLYREILKTQPQNILIHNNLGVILDKSKQYDQAETSYRKALDLKSDYVDAHYNLGKTLSSLTRFDEAEASYRKAIELKPDYTLAIFSLAVLLHNLNRLDEAEINYRKLTVINSDYPDIHIKSSHNLNDLISERLLLDSIKNEKYEKKIKISFFKKVNSKLFGSDLRLTSNPYISYRTVEPELIDILYQIKSKKLNTFKQAQAGNNGPFYGSGLHSINFQLFEQLKEYNCSLIENVKKDLTIIMQQAVKSKIYIKDSFFSILSDGVGGTVIHTHLTSLDKRNSLINQKYSLQYYLSIGDQTCSEPGIFKMSDPAKEILPSKGMITIIPASRKHAAVYNGKTERIMIGINFYSLN